MVRSVIFDIGNVLITFDKLLACEELTTYTKEKTADEIHKLLVGEDLEHLLETGTISETQFAKKALTKINAQGLDEKKFLEIWSDVYEGNNEIIDLLNELHERSVPMAIVSTNSTVAYAACRKFETVRLFEDWKAPIILSHEVGVTKPNEKIFRLALEALGCEAKDAAFIDDITENIEAAKNLGMAGIEYNAKVHSIQYLRDELSSLIAL